MKRILLFLPIILVFISSPSIAQEAKSFESKLTAEQISNAPAMLIPFPKKIQWDHEYIKVKEFAVTEIDKISTSIREELESIFELNQISLSTSSDLLIAFKNDKTFDSEEYEIAISKTGIEIKSATEAGHFYALQTLRQLFQIKQGSQVLPICSIKDAPSFKMRGYMLDVGRNFQSLASLKKQLDIMARYKLNVFQWHLTDRPAWRIESKQYPELTAAENHRSTRDPGKFYTYDDIRELIDYAKERHISIIPEIDMPGHSDSFVKAMGVTMESKKGMDILENIINEFFAEIPKSDCPIIHLGSDEVKIDNPEEFMSKMISVCKKGGREVMTWNPGLATDDSVIRQTWLSKHLEKANYREIDSWNNYVNNGEPMTQILRLLFKPVGYPSTNEMMGSILCLWPDVNLENEDDAIYQNPLYPSLLTFAWKTWTADILKAPEAYYMTLPPRGSAAFNYFAAFEEILMHHKARFFQEETFPYQIQNDKIWKLIGTFNGDDGDALLKNIKDSYSYKGEKVGWQIAMGNTLVIKDRFKLGGYYPNAKKGQTAYALTYIHSDKNRSVDTWIGFETPMRSNRTYTGIPHQGKWDVSGGNIWINDKPLPSPIWKDAGWRPDKSEGWSTPHQEKSWGAEELYWTRTPTKISLKKGWNKVLVKIPCSSNYQNWMFTFVPLDMEGLVFSTTPTDHSTYYHQKKTHFEQLPNHKNEIIFIGDSIIDGCEWSELLDNKNIKNRGISGDVTLGILDRLKEVTESNPKKVFLMIGINDLARGKSADYVIDNISRIVATINAASPKTEVFVQSILPVNDHYNMFNGHTDKANEVILINEALANGAKGSYLYIDLHTSFLDKTLKLNTELSNDGLHLNGKGYQLWASLIKEYVK